MELFLQVFYRIGGHYVADLPGYGEGGDGYDKK